MILWGPIVPEKNVLYKCDVWFIERSFTQLMDGHTRGFKQ